MDEMSLAAARDHLSRLVSDVHATHERIVITKHGRPAAVLIAPDDLASLEETLSLLSDPDALAAVRRAETEYERGASTTGAEMHRLLEERRRRESGAA